MTAAVLYGATRVEENKLMRNAAILAIAALAATPVFAAQSYVAVPLGTLGGPGSAGLAINAGGTVTGYAYTSEHAHAFVYAAGAIRDLGTVDGVSSYGTAINASGQVAGYGYAGDGSPSASAYLLAFMYSGGVMKDLGTLGGHGAKAAGISASGQVVGWSDIVGDTAEHAFVYANGLMTDIGVLPGGADSEADAINGAGQVTGRASLPSSDPEQFIQHAFLYAGGVMRDLGTLSGPSDDSEGNAINDNGDIVGTSFAILPDNQGSLGHAFLYAGGSMRDLGALGGDYIESVGLGINSARDVVGASTNAQGDLSHAFIYTDGAIHDLNALVASGLGSATLTDAHGINDQGQIAATGCGAIPAVCQAFRLDPVPANPVIPDPVSVVEFYYPPFDHYFITADATEIAALDAGAFPGWVRTGQTFNAYATPAVGAEQVCRFFNDSFAPKSSHFYSADPNECLFVKTYPNWAWQFEGVTMYIPTPDGQGACPANTHPVYRLYNNGMGGAPNHRYTASLSTRSQMITQGWVSEGFGPMGVIMCAPR